MSPQPSLTKTKKEASFFSAVGRRRTATARVRLYPKRGDSQSTQVDLTINDKPAEEYFPNPVMQRIYAEPLRTTNAINRFRITVKVSGSGKTGQLEAISHGIARALVKADATQYKPILRKRDFLTRDPRMKERRKVGTGGKARRQKQSPKR